MALPRRSLLRLLVPALAAALAALGGCARLGDLGGGVRGALAEDARSLLPGDLAAPGPLDVVAQGTRLDGLPCALYRPRDLLSPAPALVFLPGLLAPEDQYESYARLLASRGLVVVVRGRYGPLRSDEELADDALRLRASLVARGLADPTRVAVAGHSRGGKDAILAAARRLPSGDRPFAAVVALDPDDGGRAPRVAAEVVGSLLTPLLLVGAEVAWKGADVCAPRARNYQRFFEGAAPGAVELTLLGADHVQLLDEPDRFGQFICRVGTADSRKVRTLARRALCAFLSTALLGAPAGALEADGAAVRIKGRGAP